MAETTGSFSGTWLDDGEKRGQSFNHTEGDYEHREADGEAPKQMRHAMVEQNGKQVGVWAPTNWTQEQLDEALNGNW